MKKNISASVMILNQISAVIVLIPTAKIILIHDKVIIKLANANDL